MKQNLSIVFLVAGIALAPTLRAAEPADIEATLARAAETYALALAREHGWSVTQPLIDEARSALEAGDLDTAAAAADRALLTAQKSLEQARAEAEGWRERIVGS